MAYTNYASPYSYMGTTYPQYNNGYNQYQQQMTQQPMMQNQSQTQDFPFSVVRFGTLDEIKGYIVPPTKAVMFIKSDFSELYLKTADAMGNPSLETLKCTKLQECSAQPVLPEIDTKNLVKREDLDNFATKDNFDALNGKISDIEGKLQKLDKLTVLLGDKENGKRKTDTVS